MHEGFRTLEKYARASDYTLILKSRPDIRYLDFDFERIWRAYSPRSPSGHFAVSVLRGISSTGALWRYFFDGHRGAVRVLGGPREAVRILGGRR